MATKTRQTERPATAPVIEISLERHEGYRLALVRQEAVVGKLEECRAEIARLKLAIRSPAALDRAADAFLAGEEDVEMRNNVAKLREIEGNLPIIELAAKKAAREAETIRRDAIQQLTREQAPRHLDLVRRQREAVENLRDVLREEVAFRDEFLRAGTGWRYTSPVFTPPQGSIQDGITDLDNLTKEFDDYLKNNGLTTKGND